MYNFFNYSNNQYLRAYGRRSNAITNNFKTIPQLYGKPYNKNCNMLNNRILKKNDVQRLE